MADLRLHFEGPFTYTAGENCVFRPAFVELPCIYLMAVRQSCDGSYLVRYIGETWNLAKRQKEHLVGFLGMNYRLFDPQKAQQGIRDVVWPGLWQDKTPDGPGKAIAAYQTFHKSVVSYLSTLSIFYAKLEPEVDRSLRAHIEGCIGWSLRKDNPEALVLYPDDNYIAIKQERNHGNLLITASEAIRGLGTCIQY